MATPRTDEEIIARINALSESDYFGFSTSDLIHRLPFAAAKPFLKPEATEDEWKPLSREPADLLNEMREYMSFAWDKANNCRGLSAGRPLSHFQAWLWLYGEEKAAEALEDYDLYGKPHLAAISEWLGVDWKKLDNEEWVSSEGGRHQPRHVTMLPFTQPVAA